MDAFDKEFFATGQDQLPNLLQVEAELKLEYVLMGMFKSRKLTVYSSAAKLPDLGVVEDGHYMQTPCYMVKPKEKRITVEKVPQNAGGVLYNIGLFKNMTPISFRPSGCFGRKVLIPGRVDSRVGNKTSLALARHFWRVLTKGYVRVGRYWIGPEAYRFLAKGGRLTPAVQCPPDMDVEL